MNLVDNFYTSRPRNGNQVPVGNLIKAPKTCFPITVNNAGIFKQSMGARNRVGIGLSYRPPEPVFLNVNGA